MLIDNSRDANASAQFWVMHNASWQLTVVMTHCTGATAMEAEQMYQLSPLNTSPSSQTSLTIPCNVFIIHPTPTCLGDNFMCKLMLIHTHTHTQLRHCRKILNLDKTLRVMRTCMNTWNETKYFYLFHSKFHCDKWPPIKKNTNLLTSLAFFIFIGGHLSQWDRKLR